MMNPKIVEIRYSIKLTETQSDLLLNKSEADFITYMENQTNAENIVWIFDGMAIATIFFSLPYENSISKVIEFLEETLGKV